MRKRLPLDVINMIASFLQKFELLSWIDPQKLDLLTLASNPNACCFLSEQCDKKETCDHVLIDVTGTKRKNVDHLCETEINADFFVPSPGHSIISEVHRYCQPETLDESMAIWQMRRRIVNGLKTQKAAQYLIANQRDIIWSSFVKNPFALEFLKKNTDKFLVREHGKTRYIPQFSANRAIFVLNSQPKTILSLLAQIVF